MDVGRVVPEYRRGRPTCPPPLSAPALDSGVRPSTPPSDPPRRDTPRRALRPLRRGVPVLLAALGVAVAAACSAPSVGPLRDPGPAGLTGAAPDSFRVSMVTSEGPVEITFHRSWAPVGVDRVWHLVRNGFYDGARFYRVEEGFVAQWGFSGDPGLDSLWREHPLADEEVEESNRRGYVSFARAGAESRSFTLFVNYADNPRLDTIVVGGVRGYPPVGVIPEEGMEVLDGLYRAYADDPPAQDSISARGNAYLRRDYPQLDSIVETRVIGRWP